MRTIANDLSDDQSRALRAPRRSDTYWLIVFGLGLAAASAIQLRGVSLMASLVLGGLMLAVAHIDARQLRIPDILSLPAIPLGLLASGHLVRPAKAQLVDGTHVIGMLAGCLTLWAIRFAYKAIRKRQGLGLGDVKLAAVAGAWVGVEALADVLLVACGLAIAGVVLAQIISGRRFTSTSAIPFGSALAPAIWLVWFRDAMMMAS